MTHITGEQEEALILAFSVLKTKEEIRGFLSDLLTPDELRNVGNRWCVAWRLLDGANQKEARISCETSKAVVTRVNRTILENGTGMSKQVHERLRGRGAEE